MSKIQPVWLSDGLRITLRWFDCQLINEEGLTKILARLGS